MEMLKPSGVPRRRYHRSLGLALVAAGALLVILAGGYYLYRWMATEGLDSLVYLPDTESTTQRAASAMTLEGLRGKPSSPLSPDAPPTGTDTLPTPASLGLYPGEQIAFNSWAEPWAAESPSSLEEVLVEGFLPVDRFVLGNMGTLPQATRISIPAIELEAEVQELGIQDLGDSRQYETPNRVVGHIPDTANPGEAGNNWLFGHLQSPIWNEGSIFRDLPRIPEILKTGQRVYVVLQGQAGSYLYEVYETDVVHQDDLILHSTYQANVTLVTCVPAFTYDYRLLVTASLVGFKPGA